MSQTVMYCCHFNAQIKTPGIAGYDTCQTHAHVKVWKTEGRLRQNKACCDESGEYEFKSEGTAEVSVWTFAEDAV